MLGCRASSMWIQDNLRSLFLKIWFCATFSFKSIGRCSPSGSWTSPTLVTRHRGQAESAFPGALLVGHLMGLLRLFPPGTVSLFSLEMMLNLGMC